MSKSKGLSILLQPEIDDLYSPPRYTIEQQRYFFSLNDKELAVAKSIRKREHRCYFVAMLGYFKTKPIVRNPNFRLIESDLSFVAKETFLGNKLRRLSLNQKQRDRLYEKLFIYFNSAILNRLLQYFEQNSDDTNLDRTKKVSHVAWVNVNLNGTYSCSFEENVIYLDEITRIIVEN